MAATLARSSMCCLERSPCFQAFIFPFGAPVFLPPWMRHRRFPLIAGAWHGVPRRVFASHRGADRKRATGFIGLFVTFSIAPSPRRSHDQR